MKAALLSNINADPVRNILAEKFDVVPSEGYGDIWGQLLDSNSALNVAKPDAIFFLVDIQQFTDNCFNYSDAEKIIHEWFLILDTVIRNDRDYFISDVMFRDNILSKNDSFYESKIIRLWLELLEARVKAHSNLHLLNINQALLTKGKNAAFSSKLWYIGKIPYSNEGSRIIAGCIAETLELLSRTAKKVLLLDLDGTLWGGVLGESGADGIILSDDNLGAVYKNVQHKIKMIQNSGILLAIVSKNNESDVNEVWEQNSHMVLKREDFAAVKINWEDKAKNIQDIAKELNLGVDSFVFIDDMPNERENIRMRLPDVIVPDFPERLENYPGFISEVFNKYFKNLRLSAEDITKTRQYIEQAKRSEAAKGLTYEEFLSSLNMKVERVGLDDAKLTRIAQLHGKTNQFNLTVMRYTRQDINRLLYEGCEIYAYNVKDKFGDYGLTAAVIINMREPEILSFLMSCRIMGKLIENYIISQVESDLYAKGFRTLRAKYVTTAKNIPVANFYEGLGYKIIREENGIKYYEIELGSRPERKYFVGG